MRYLTYADGACSGNGRNDAKICGSFAVYPLDDGDIDHASLAECAPLHHASHISLVIPKGVRATNNLAEALTLHAAIAWLCANRILAAGNFVTICMDSQIVLCQMTGLYRTRGAPMRDVYSRIYELLGRQSKKAGKKLEEMLEFSWISGEVMKASVIAH